jgi:NADH-quinone oxidoreductase subunit G
MPSKKPTTKTGKANTAATAAAPLAPAAGTGPAQPPALPPAPEGMINVFVDGTLLHVKKGSTVMQAITAANKETPHFCYHERLSIAGNCRMCLVEIEGMPKPIASCHWPASEGMKIRTDSPMTIAARKGTMELLLINHPLDCPICDQGGECALQDQSVAYGGDRSHYHEFKRAVDDKDIGSKIKTVMTRCIHCTRCVRFATEIAGVEEFGATGRGENMQIGTYVEQALQSELAGNMIDLCPVGALTSRPYAYTARPWELVRTHGVDVLDATGTPISIDNRHGQVMRTLPLENNAINEEWMTDTARFSYDTLHTNRLTSPMLKKIGKPAATSWPEAFAAIKKSVEKSSGKTTAAIMGNLQSAEDAYAFRAFMQNVLKSANVDSRTPGSTLSAQYTFAQPFAALEQADAVLLIGCNPRLEAPLLNVRLRRAALKRRVPIALIGAPAALTYPHQHLGTNPAEIANLAKAKSFGDTLKAAQHAVIILSASIFERTDGDAIYAAAQKLADKTGAILNVLADTCGRITALDMAVLPGASGKDTSAILKAWQKGQIDTLIIYGEDSITAEELGKGSGTLIYIGTHLTPLAKLAHIILPAAAFTEKSGLYANAEGRVQLSNQAVQPPLNAKEDWKIFRALSEELGNTLPFNTLAQLRTLIAKAHPAYAQTNWNKPHPAQPAKLKAAGEPTTKAFTSPVTEYYLRLEYLRQSPTMQKMQAEQGTAQIKKNAA